MIFIANYPNFFLLNMVEYGFPIVKYGINI